MQLYKFQEQAIADLQRPEKHICIALTGAGKGSIMLHWLMSTGKKKWLVVTTASKRDSADVEHEALEWLGEESLSSISLEVISWSGLAKWTTANWNSLDDYAFAFDECLVANTLVDTDHGRVPIAELCVGDRVWSYNEETQECELKRVERLIKKPMPSRMYCLRSHSGAIISTGNHPHYTQCGWVAAEDIKVGDTLYEPEAAWHRTSTTEVWRQPAVRVLPQTNTSRRLDSEPNTTSGRARQDILQQRMWQSEPCQAKQRKNEATQPYVEPRVETEGTQYQETERFPTSLDNQARIEGRQRPLYQAADTPSQDVEHSEQWVGNGATSQSGSAPAGLSEVLQGRHREHLPQNSSRVRRGQPQRARSKESRPEEDSEIRGVRVESIEVLEPRDIRERGLCSDANYVYCIDVEDNHNFFANGFLTHNCHLAKAGVSSNRGRSFIQIARQTDYWTGYTATPGDRWIDFYAYFTACGFVKNKTQFQREFCQIQTYKGYPEIIGYQDEKTLRAWWAHITVCPDTQQMIDELPEESHKTIRFKCSPAYKRFKKDRIDENGEFVETVMGYCHKLRQLCLTADKLQWISDYLEGLGTNTVLFYNYIEEGEQIAKVAGRVLPKGARVWRIDGKHHEIPTAETIGKYDIVLAQYTSGSASLNLQFMSQWVSVSPNYSYTVSIQARGRIKRIGQKQPMFFWYLVCDDSIEDDVYRCLREKSDFSEEVWMLEEKNE